jgi:lysophospholipase L1-like esterase
MDPTQRWASIVAVAAACVSVAAAAVSSGPALRRAAQALADRLRPAPQATPRLRVVCLGDSITAQGYPEQLAELLGPGYRVSNEGVPGETTAQLLGRWRYGIALARPDVLVLQGGVNDLRLGTGFAAPAANHLLQIAGEAEQAGSRVVLVAALPFQGAPGWSEALEQERLALARALAEHCAASAGAACVDVAAMASGAALRPELDAGDHVHLGRAGQRRLAELVAERVRGLSSGS